MTAPPSTIELGGRTYTVERPTGLKASRALAQMRALSKAMPELSAELAQFRQQYERDNVLELDRVQARMRYPARPLVIDDEPVMEEVIVERDDEGKPIRTQRRPVMLPSPADRISDEDWAAAGGIYRVPASPSSGEIVAALFDRALEVAEEHVYKLIALFTIPNSELKALRRAGGTELDDALTARAGELLEDAFADELLELAVMVGETVDHHFRRKTADLGDRVGNALRLVGINWTPASPTPTSTPTPSSEKPSSSTDSDANTDGDPTPPSTPPSTSSSSSDDSSTSTPNEPSSPSSSAPMASVA
jgi:hypothetical protein